MIDYSTPDLIDWSKTECTPWDHVWKWDSASTNEDIDPLMLCDCGCFEYRQVAWRIKDLMGIGHVNGV